jgi:hypothetical protein
MRKLVVLPLALLAVACASVNREPTPGRPAIRIVQKTPLFFGSGFTAPLNIELTIANVAKEPIRVRRVRLQPGPAMTQYSVYPASRIVSEVIQPGQTAEVDVVMTAYTDIRRLHPTEPLGIRALIDYESGGKRFQELYIILQIEQE